MLAVASIITEMWRRFDLFFRNIVTSVEKGPVICPERRCGDALFVADLSGKLEEAHFDAIRDDLFQFQDILDRLDA